MKNIGIFFTEPGFFDYPFNENEYKDGYFQLARLLNEHEADCFLVRAQSTYIKGNRFNGGWKFEEDHFKRIDEPIELDVIFNKGNLQGDSEANIVVDPEMEAICTNKNKTYEFFSEYCPRTTEVKDIHELNQAIETMPGSMVVAKPLDDFGGHGVMIGSKEEICTQVRNFPYLIQEFLDTSLGIPGITEQSHDFRILIVNGEIVSTLLRTPKAGSLVSNVAQGGYASVVPLKDIPSEVLNIVKKVDEKFRCFKSRIYSVDLGLHLARVWKIIELNCQPGLSIDDYNDGETGKHLFKSVVDTLLEAAATK